MAATEYSLGHQEKRVFIGLVLGMFVAAISMTIVGPAMPRIVAELGGMEHYSWLATSSMLVTAVTTPIVGKLSDMYGRRPFYLAGLILFMVGSALAGLSMSFAFLIFARCVQGVGMGILMPLSQTIIGDIIPPRQRGKYQGYMGASMGVAQVAGPLAGGAMTDAFGWRVLFYASIPIGIVAFIAIARFLHLPHTPRQGRIDHWGITTLTLSMVSLLLAISFGGSTFAWGSWQILAMLIGGAILLGVFIYVETKVDEPVIPLGLFRNSIFTWSNVAGFVIAMMMFGIIIYVPVYAQGVMGASATESGLILMPMNIAMILVSIIIGLLITRTGRYKEFTLAGVLLMGVGAWLMSLLTYGDSPWQLSLAVLVFGVGLGACMQQYVLIVQNAVSRRDLGVATSSTQFVRVLGQTIGISLFGTLMNVGLVRGLPDYLPAGTDPASVNAGVVLDPAALAQLPPAVADAVRHALADSLGTVFLLAVPLAVVALVATLAIRALPLRDTVHTVEEMGQEALATMGQTSGDARQLRVPIGRYSSQTRTGERLMGLQLRLLSELADADHNPLLRRAVTDLGDGDFQRGLARLSTTALMLTTEDPEVAADAEQAAVVVAAKDEKKGGVLSEELRAELAVAAAEHCDEKVLAEIEPTVGQRYQALDITRLRHVSNDLTAALLVDLDRRRRAEQATGEAL
ncbi:MDR family MFS transporter [Tessaracoccus sp. SD287]|uniref:MDR family MFS transporter n=1 Tax=Tessaracoccus sp. SD287 TaxID=2782008 RepID=UPI001A966886